MRRIFIMSSSLLLAAGLASAQSNDFRWSGSLASGKTIEIKGVNGAIRAELATGNQVEVTATKRSGWRDHDDRDWRGRSRREPSSLDSVKIEVVPSDSGVTICAVYPTPDRSRWLGRRGDRDDRPNECRPGAEGRMNVFDNNVVVDFVVKVPAGVKLMAKTVNGSVDAQSLKSDATIHTVNGKIAVSTSGIAAADTVNGSIEATIGDGAGKEALEYHTVNGSITLNVPKGTNAEIHARTSNGRFESDLPLTVQSFSGRARRVDGTLGNGGKSIELHTVNGAIRLRART